MLESNLFWSAVMVIAVIICGHINKKRGKNKKEFIAMTFTIILCGVAGMVYFGPPVF